MPHDQERRKHQRFRLPTSPAEVNVLEPCRIVDIGLGGLAFYYAGPERWPESPRSWAKLLFGEDELCLDAIPLRTVADQVIAHELVSGLPAVRRRNVAFGRLRPYQQVMLRYFIWLKTRCR